MMKPHYIYYSAGKSSEKQDIKKSSGSFACAEQRKIQS